MKRLLVLAALLCMTTSVATAQMRLAWDDCGAGGTQDNQFVCTSNTNHQTIISSFIAPAGFNNFNGATTEIVIGTAGPLPAWWRMEAGTGCVGRAGVSMTSDDGALSPAASCNNPFAEFVTPNLTLQNYESNYQGNPARAKFTGDLARSDLGVPLVAGQEYLANSITLRVAKSTGTGSCAGCIDAACLVTVRMVLSDTQNGEINLTGPPNAFVLWHGGAIGGAGCPAATPTRKQTWGQVKSLYR